jgi:molybdenum cofactor cytidylyltransferase
VGKYGVEAPVSNLGNLQVKGNPVMAASAGLPPSKLDVMAVPAIILAAGASRRLGQPKQLVRIASETLLARTVRIVRESGAEPIVVVLGAHCEAIRSSVDLSGSHVVVNEAWEQGIATSICAGVEAIQRLVSTAAAAMLLVCDQPRLTADHLRELISISGSAEEATIAASGYAGIAGIPAVFHAAQFSKLLALTGDTGARYLLRDPGCPMIIAPFAGGEIDIDTPADLSASLYPLSEDD